MGGVFELMTAGSSIFSAISMLSLASIRSTRGPKAVEGLVPFLRVLDPFCDACTSAVTVTIWMPGWLAEGELEVGEDGDSLV
jgi:hypothetical protein